MWVVGAGVLARLFAPMLLDGTSGRVNRVLSHRVNVNLTSNEIVFHLFEKRTLTNLNSQILVTLMRNLADLSEKGRMLPAPVHATALRKILIPEQYWSGCPPNA